MKKTFCILILLAIVLSFGCDRYPDGPLISFHSPETRIEGTWQIVSFTSDGVDSLQNLIDNCGNNMSIQIQEGAAWYNLWFPNGSSAIWAFYDNKKMMQVNFHSGTNYIPGEGPFKSGYIYEEWRILELTMINFKMSTTYNGRYYLISFNK
jgi:hypothetical protein